MHGRGPSHRPDILYAYPYLSTPTPQARLNKAGPHAGRARPQVEKRGLKECMSEKPPECETFRFALFECRKSQVDARTRLKGNKGY